MSAEKTYRVRRSDSTERNYHLHELTWLWRTAEMPHDAVFLTEKGDWRPLRELIEPILAARKVEPMGPLAVKQPRLSRRWRWAMTVGGLVMVLAGATPLLTARYQAWQIAREHEREALERENAARKQDFISSNVVVHGMTREEVRRAVGEPRSMKATGDGHTERWIYRTQIIVFVNGKVIGTEEGN